MSTRRAFYKVIRVSACNSIDCYPFASSFFFFASPTRDFRGFVCRFPVAVGQGSLDRWRKTVRDRDTAQMSYQKKVLQYIYAEQKSTNSDRTVQENAK
jgi:hypothetical protein